MKADKVLVIINPAAGRKMARKALYPIVQALCDQELLVTVFSTSAGGEAYDYILNYGKDYERVICCGGDGTFNEVLSGILAAELDIPVGYIPTGSTNDLARSISLPTKRDKAIELAVRGEGKQHDIGLFNGKRYFDYVASFGAFVNVSYSTPQPLKNLFGHFAYILYSIPKVFEIKPYHLKVVADGMEIEGDFLFGAVSNATQIAGIIKFPKKKVDLNDGLFEVTLIKALHSDHSGKKELSIGSRGKIYFFKAKHVTFYFEKEIAWTVDGEYAGAFKSVEIDNINNAVKIVSANNKKRKRLR